MCKIFAVLSLLEYPNQRRMGVPKTPRLREWRERAALSQGELAQRSGISRATIADLEAGNRGGQPKTVRQLAQALSIEPEDLYGEVYPKEESRSSLEPSLFNGLEDERRPEDEAAIAVLYRGLARRATLIAERARREGPSADLSEEATALHYEAAALKKIRGPAEFRGAGSEELADAEGAYLEAESAIQEMLRQDVEATDQERNEARKFRLKGSGAQGSKEADAS
jgi:transcriptional regulator with XRE-family HTH domain